MNAPHRRTPPLLSAFVYPGAGQLAQKRWFAGAFILVLFTAAFVAFLVLVVGFLYANLDAALDFFNPEKELRPFPWGAATGCLGAALLLYALGIVDAARAARRPSPPKAPSP